MKLFINKKEYDIEVEGGMPLLWVIRDELNLKGTKYGCGVSSCGSCSVMVDGKIVRSCIVPVAAAQGKEITTIEGLGSGSSLSSVQRAWIEHQVPQCGYCQSGMIIAAEALLMENETPSDLDIDNSISNICRCGTYPRVREAIHTAAKMKLESNDLLD